MKQNRVIALIMAVLMLGMLFTGCGAGEKVPVTTSSANPSVEVAPTEKLPCRYVVPGSEPIDLPVVEKAINEKLQNDGVNLDFKMIFVPWDVWQQKTNIMMSTGEEFELIHIMEDMIPSSVLAGQGGLVPLDDYLPQYGKKLNEMIPAEIWDLTRISGKIYSIPVYFRDFSSNFSKLGVQKQLFDKYDLSLVPKDREELVTSWETIIKNEKNPDLRYWFKINPTTALNFERGYDSFPFAVIDSLFFVDQQGNVKPWLETEEFKQDCEFYRSMYTKGITHPDLLTIPQEKIGQLTEQGNSLSSDAYSVEAIKKNKPDVEFYEIMLHPEKPLFRGEWPIMNANGISSTSKHPEAGVMFYNWVYSSQENYDLLNYGIKDKHWKEAGERRFEVIAGADGKSADYTFGDWEMGHYKLVRLPKAAPKELEPMMLKFDPNAVNSVAAGFKFDSESVASEYAAVMAEIESSIYPIKYGVISYEKGYTKALVAMNNAGYDKVVEEYQKQFKVWFDAKSK